MDRVYDESRRLEICQQLSQQGKYDIQNKQFSETELLELIQNQQTGLQ